MADLVRAGVARAFNLVATGIFTLAVIHTFGSARVTALSHRVQHDHDRPGDYILLYRGDRETLSGSLDRIERGAPSLGTHVTVSIRQRRLAE